MKEILKCIFVSIVMMLPVILIIITFFRINNFRTAMQVNSENLEKVQTLAESIDLGIPIDENVKEIAVVSEFGDPLAYRRYEIVYHNNEVKETKTEVLQDKGALWGYISENSEDNDYDDLLLISIPISIIASIVAFRYLNKTEIIEDNE